MGISMGRFVKRGLEVNIMKHDTVQLNTTGMEGSRKFGGKASK